MSNGKRIKLEDEEDLLHAVKYEDIPCDGHDVNNCENGIVEKIVYGNEEYLVMPVKCEVDEHFYNNEDYEISGHEGNNNNISGLLSVNSCEDQNMRSIIKDEVGEEIIDATNGSSDEKDISNLAPGLPKIFGKIEKQLIGKNGYIWSPVVDEKQGNCSTANYSNNIPKYISAVVPSVNKFQKPEDIFKIFFPVDMIRSIVTNTNIYITQLQSHSKASPADCDTTDEHEIYALLGLLVLTGALNMNHVSVTDLFDPIYSGNIFKCTFTQDRFQFLQNSLRFGNQSDIAKNLDTDQFAQMRFTWEHFVTICRQSFYPGSSITVGEHSLPFSGQCTFKKANPGGTDYIKLMIICDSHTKYMFDAFPHLGKGLKNMTHVKDWIKRLTRSIYGTKRNIVVDSWPVPLKFASELMASPYGLTIVAPTPQNQTSIPRGIYNFKKKKIATSTISQDADKILLAYNESHNDLTLLVSTFNQNVKKSDIKNQPDLLMYYNENRAAIDVFDQMCKRYSCSRISGLWPLCVFHGMINIACVNSYIIYRYNMEKSNHRLLGARDFMKRISQELIKPFLRKKQSSIGSQLEETMQTILTDSDERDDVGILPEDQQIEKRTICRICPAKRRRMTVYACKKCRRPYCREHRSNCCSECGC